MKDNQIKYMVDRFLGWKLPENFNPDCGISFKQRINEGRPTWPQKNEPTGTNLLDAEQAEEMIRFIVQGMPKGENCMQPFQERVVSEKKELDEKIDKLDIFRAGEVFPTLPEDEQGRLNMQLSHMRAYSGVLADRIEAFQPIGA